MDNFIIIAILVVIIGFAAFYVYRAKKSGRKCIGCPDGKTCGKNAESSCSCCSCCCSGEDNKNNET